MKIRAFPSLRIRMRTTLTLSLLFSCTLAACRSSPRQAETLVQAEEQFAETESQPGQEQLRDYFKEGNFLLQRGRPDRAEVRFRLGLAADPARAVDYESQIALSLLQQGEFEAAERILEPLLVQYPNNPAVAWYWGLSAFFSQNYAQAISRLDAAIPILEAAGQPGQIYSSRYFISESYWELLGKTGLTFSQVEAMIDALDYYVTHAPRDEQAPTSEERLRWLRENRPSENVERWVHYHWRRKGSSRLLVDSGDLGIPDLLTESLRKSSRSLQES